MLDIRGADVPVLQQPRFERTSAHVVLFVLISTLRSHAREQQGGRMPEAPRSEAVPARV
jgi:hypothetical protein